MSVEGLRNDYFSIKSIDCCSLSTINVTTILFFKIQIRIDPNKAVLGQGPNIQLPACLGKLEFKIKEKWGSQNTSTKIFRIR